MVNFVKQPSCEIGFHEDSMVWCAAVWVHEFALDRLLLAKLLRYNLKGGELHPMRPLVTTVMEPRWCQKK